MSGLRAGAAVLALLGVSCAHGDTFSNSYAPMGAPVGERCLKQETDGSCALYDLSLLELIAVPEKYHGKRVLVVGFATLQFEGNALCPTDRLHSPKDCLWLDVEGLEDPGFRRGYVLVEGTFDGENRGHLGVASGAIVKITRFQRWR